MRKFCNQKGMTTVEVLLITPFALFFFMATIQVLQALAAQNVAASAAREAARTYAVYHDAALARQRADEVISGTLPTGREGKAAAAELEGSGVEYLSVNLSEVAASKDNITFPVTVLNNGPDIVADRPVSLSYHLVDGKGNTVLWDGARTPFGGLKRGESRAATLAVPQKDFEQMKTKDLVLKIDLVKEGCWWASQRGSPMRSVTYGELKAALDVAEELKKKKEEGVEYGPAPDVGSGGQLSMSETPHEEKEYTCNFDPERDVKLYDDGAFCTAVVDYHIRTVCPALPKLFNPDASAWAGWIDVSGRAVFKHEIETP
ncbi:MAG: TadE/TadG family type IV pilus assembly protein [Bacillota bacterium]